MTPERWQQIEQLYHSALERDALKRAAYLQQACAGDDELRQEVESLLAHGKATDGWSRDSALGQMAANALGPGDGRSLLGRQLGSFQVLSLLGAGGMGEVYEARDTKLGRKVAIKFLPKDFVHEPERVTRFQREARMLAALNHPNIATIYGLEHSDGVHYLVMELIPGQTLQEEMKGRPLKVEDALRIAAEIAEALEAAHEKGIIHRDLKPANVKVTPEGRVKVLDFGLAKAFAGEGGLDLSQAPTLTAMPTEEGRMLGTPAYMSPEQARGKPVDKRTDIWAFGCVLYELLTGKQAFHGETMQDTVAAVLEREPAWHRLSPAIPARIRDLLRRALQKDPQRRLRDLGDARIEIEDALAVRGRSPRRFRMATMAIAAGAAIVLALVASLLWVRFLSPNRRSPAAATSYVQLTDFNDSALAPALSPDGRMLTFIRGGNFADSAQRGQIYVKFLPTGEPVQLTHDELQKEQPVFSPDGSRVTYAILREGFKWDSWQVPVLGGAPQPFLPNASGLLWMDDRRLLYSEIMSGVHMGIVSSTQTRTDHKSIYLPPLEGGMAHRSAPSPDRKSLLVVEMDGGGWLPCRLMPFDGSSTGHAVGPPEAQCTSAAWSPDGGSMYFSSNAGGGFHIWRQRYPDGVPEQITSGPAEQEGTAVTPDGKSLITSIGFQEGSVWLHDSAGDRQITSEGFAMLPTMAPSGDRVFYLVRSSSARGFASGELWSKNLATGERQPVLPGYVMGNYSISHDGMKVVFTSVGNPGGDGVWIADLDRGKPPRQLTRGEEFRAFFGAPGEIIYMDQDKIRHLFRMKEDGSGKERITPDAVYNLISVSPDGRWALMLMPRSESEGVGTYMELLSLHGEEPVPVCNSACTLGFGPVRLQASPISWSRDGKSLFVGLQYFGLRTGRTVVLPYRSDVPLKQLWPKGLKTETDVAANPDAKVIGERDVFPAPALPAYLFWRRSTRSNLYRMPIPN